MTISQRLNSNPGDKTHDGICEFGGIVFGNTTSMSTLYTMIQRIAVTDYPVLITGETGSGKEVAATLIHHFSKRKKDIFIDINCGAIPENLIESHLFGHEQGAFTGAVNKHQGYFATVGSGTLFLDEIAELPLHQQIKLLRVLETHTFRPVGAIKNLPFTGRIIAATHQNLERMVNDKNFREDLFYRLNVFNLKVPPLRERKADIPKLIEQFSRQQKRPFGFTKEAISALSEADWPGNIRQLKNTVDKIAVLCDENPVSAATVNEYIQKQKTKSNDVLESIARSIINLDFKNKIVAIESTMIKLAMNDCSGNKSKAAKLLGVHRKYIERRLKAFDCDLKHILTLIHEGKKDMRCSLYGNAIVKFKEAIYLLADYTESVKIDLLRLELLVNIGICIRTFSGWNDPELNNIYKEAEELGTRLNKIGEVTSVQIGIWAQHLMNLELDKGLEMAEKLRITGENVGKSYVLLQSYIAFANFHFWYGEYNKTQEYLNSFLDLYQHGSELPIENEQDPFVLHQMFLALNSFHIGNIKKATDVLQEIFVYVDKINHPFTTVIALLTGAWLEYLLGNFDRSYAYASDLILLSRENSFQFFEGLGMIFRGAWIATNMNPHTGIDEIKNGYTKKMLNNGGCVFNSMFAIVLGTVYLLQEKIIVGVELVDQAIRLSRQKSELCYLSELMILRGKFSLLDGDAEHARQEFELARNMALKTGSLPAELKAGIALVPPHSTFIATNNILLSTISKFPHSAHYTELDDIRAMLESYDISMQGQTSLFEEAMQE